jgi:hypothetical protein
MGSLGTGVGAVPELRPFFLIMEALETPLV